MTERVPVFAAPKLCQVADDPVAVGQEWRSRHSNEVVEIDRRGGFVSLSGRDEAITQTALRKHYTRDAV